MRTNKPIITVPVSPAQHAWLRQRAYVEGTSINEVVRTLIDRAMREGAPETLWTCRAASEDGAEERWTARVVGGSTGRVFLAVVDRMRDGRYRPSIQPVDEAAGTGRATPLPVQPSFPAAQEEIARALAGL